MNKKLIILLASYFLLIISCTEQIDIETNSSTPVIVINGCITDRIEHQRIYISSSAPYFQNTHNAKISGATVNVTCETNKVWEFNEDPLEAGTYISQEKVGFIIGESYTLHVECDFNKDGMTEQYSAKTIMQPRFITDSIKVNHTNIMGKYLYTVNLYAQDIIGKDYYCSRCYVNGSLISTKITRYWTFDDKIFDGEYLNGFLVYYLADRNERDKYTDDEADKLTFVGKGDKISIEMIKIERGYYNFLNQCREGESGESIFGGSPANIISNITNGGVGFFTAFSPYKVETVIIE